tara:strand:- start:47 stop:700 length:654 start_codon:yes stop_codon:yes gene_type:complete
MIIAIDGLAGSGKSSTAKGVAKKLGFFYLDTGAMYRAVTFGLIKSSIKFDEFEKIENFLDNSRINFNLDGSKINLNGRNITNEIRKNLVTLNVSEVSSLKLVRKKMVYLQKKIVENKNFVVEGRDIGTTVFPKADFKFFLKANIKQRSIRRKNQNFKQGNDNNINEITSELKYRDKKDSSREISPLVKAKDAITIDTSNITLNDQISLICNYISSFN